MKAFMAAVRKFVRDERGVTAIEYGLIASVIALAVGTAAASVRDALTTVFASIVSALGG